MHNALLLLRILTERLAPPKGKRHALLVDDTSQLVALIWIGENPREVSIETPDLNRRPEELGTAIVELLAAARATNSTGAQGDLLRPFLDPL